MSSPSLAEMLDSHVSLELEGIDRLYLDVYVSTLQYPSGVASLGTLNRPLPRYCRQGSASSSDSVHLLSYSGAVSKQKRAAICDFHQPAALRATHNPPRRHQRAQTESPSSTWG